MLAYKAFSKDLRATAGNGFQFEIGNTYETEEANREKNGFHCAENPLDVFQYYDVDARFCEVDIDGDIDDGDHASVIVGTRITIVRELSLKEMVEGFIEYMLNYPNRPWEKSGCNVFVKSDKAEVENKGIAIARGMSPEVRGGKGSILALIQEDADGTICGAWIEEVDGKEIKPGEWYTLNE